VIHSIYNGYWFWGRPSGADLWHDLNKRNQHWRAPIPALARLLSVNVGLPRDINWKGRTVRTGNLEGPRARPLHAGSLNLAGDGQGDLAGHGGEPAARSSCTRIESYRYWEKQLGRSDFVLGQFGENLTVEELPDDEVCIGDQYEIGNALFEVTQPRVTCYRLGIRMNEPRMPALLTSRRTPGFYSASYVKARLARATQL